jgi:hypothetical protein
MGSRERLIKMLTERCREQVAFAEQNMRKIAIALQVAKRELEKAPDLERAWDNANVLVTSTSKLADTARALCDHFQE